MKKVMVILLAMLIVFASVTANAATGDKIGTLYHSDIVALINNYAIPSYTGDGKTLVVVDDLKNFGFDIYWYENSRRIAICPNDNIFLNEMRVSKIGAPGSEFADLIETDISVYADGQRLSTYAINGYILIPLEELTVLGAECNWVEWERTIKLWVNGKHVRYAMQNVSKYVPPVTYTAPSYSNTAYNTYIGPYVGSVNSNIYHYPSCQWANRIYPQNKIRFNTEAHARSRGYRACYVCNP